MGNSYSTLCIINDAEIASSIAAHVRDNFNVMVKVEEMDDNFRIYYRVSAFEPSAYLMGYVDGVLHQHQFDILHAAVSKKEEQCPPDAAEERKPKS